MFAASKTKQGSSSSVVANYIEDVFSTYLYTGTNATLNINNGIDIAGNGGMVWLKNRSTTSNNFIWDTIRGVSGVFYTNTVNSSVSVGAGLGLTSFNSNGFTLGTNFNGENSGSSLEVSWTFRKQPKFFDIVTYTGTGGAQSIAHNLGSVPGFIIVKRINSNAAWPVYHQSIGNTGALLFNNTSTTTTDSTFWNDTSPTSTNFTVGSHSYTNASGGTYVAYLFANNAGGFGLTGSDNVITCGTFNTDSTGAATINLGYEPQNLIWKSSTSVENWANFDTMRGWNNTTADAFLSPNLGSAESIAEYGTPTSTGFISQASPNQTYIFIAIRKGPMKVPTDATKVFIPIASNDVANTKLTTNFPLDSQWWNYRGGTSLNTAIYDRLRGISSNNTASGYILKTTSTAAEATGNYTLAWDNIGYKVASGLASLSMIYWNFKRAPSFFDAICYTGNGIARTLNHNLGVTPEFIIVKRRDSTGDWPTWSSALALGSNMYLNNVGTVSAGNYDVLNGNNTTGVSPTSTTFAIGNNAIVNANNGTYVAYLFATCPGVSKVGSYTGTGTLTTINCGFTGGARFVIIKRTDAAYGWFVWDTARGMVAGTDPVLALNSTAAESNTDSVYTTATGFQLLASPSADVNTSGGTYIYIAIA